MRAGLIALTAILMTACGNQSGQIENGAAKAETELAAKITTSYHRPVYSPDGTSIVFMKQDAATSGDWELFIAGADGENATRLTSHKGWDGYATFSPDGRRISFDRDDGEGSSKYVVIMDLESGGEKSFAGVDGWLSIAQWLGDGERLLGVYEANGQRDVVIVSVAGTVIEKLTDTPDISEGDAFLSKDETLLFFASSSPEQGSAMETINLSTGERRILVQSNGGRIYGGALSPDETTISYNDDAPGGDDDDAEIYLYSLTSGDIRQITDNTAWDHQLVWSPDEKSALFTSYRTGLERIFKYDVTTGQVDLLYPEE